MTVLSRLWGGVRMTHYAVRSMLLRHYFQLAYPGVRCHPTVRFGRGVTIRAFDGGTLEIGAGSVVLDYAWLQSQGGRLKLGQNCLIGRGAVIICSADLEIGDGVLTAEHVTIRDQDHIHQGSGRLEAQGSTAAPIRIGSDVWLAAKVTVTKGVEIAPRAVVGANSVVTRSLDQRGVYGGAPARLIRAIEPDNGPC